MEGLNRISAFLSIAYLKERADNSTLVEAELRRRLRAHLIPYAQLAVGCEGLSDDERRARVKTGFHAVIGARAELLASAAATACAGHGFERLELKAVKLRGDRVAGPHPDGLADEMAAFANSSGGVLVLGIDEQPVVQAPLNGLEPAFYERFRTTRTRDDTLEFLRKSGIVALDDQGIAHPSVAGILVACGEPREWMPNAFIRAVAYRGTSPAATDADG